MTKQYADLYNYANYREFLADYQKARYKVDPKFSRSKISHLLGLPNTRSYFRDVLAGKNITETFVERFITAFEMDKKEARYFRVLVQYTQSRSEEERERLFDQLIALNQTPKRFISKELYAYYREKHYSVVRAALDVFPLKNNYKSFGRRLMPVLTEKKVKDSLTLLKRLGLVVRDGEGWWKPKEKNITAGFCGQNEAVKQYQLGMLEQGKKALLANMKVPNQTVTITFSLSEKTLKRIEKRVEKFRSEIYSIIHKDELPASKVYQINLQYFPQTKSNPTREQ